MIYYFSGTGNSKWVAEQIGKETGDELINLNNFVATPAPVKKGEQLGLVFPIYAWGTPEIIDELVEKIRWEDGGYLFAVATCGEEVGYAMDILAKKIPLNSGFSLVMPNNYVIGSDVDGEELRKEKVRNAKEKLASICETIKKREDRFDLVKGKFPFFKSYFITPAFNRFARTTRPFFTTDECDICGVCVEICPLKAIYLFAGKPRWEKYCYQCLACINRCPQRAIQYGKATEDRGRYYFKDE